MAHFLDLADVPALYAHRYLSTDRFSELHSVRRDGRSTGTPIDIQNFGSLHLQASQLGMLVKSTDDLLRSKKVSSDIKFVFTVDSDISAYTCKIGETYCVVIDIITGFYCNHLPEFYYYCDEYFSRVNLKKIEPHREIRYFARCGPYLQNFGDIANIEHPSSESDWEACGAYGAAMLWCIAAHELSHIINGHIDYICDNASNVTPIDRQALEFDADSCAIMWSLAPYPEPFQISEKYPSKFCLSDYGKRHIFIVLQAWRTIEYQGSNNYDQQKSFHLDGGRRFVHVPNMVNLMLERQEVQGGMSVDRETCDEQIANLLIASEGVHRTAFGPVQSTSFAELLRSESEGDMATHQVRARLRDLAPYLRPYDMRALKR